MANDLLFNKLGVMVDCSRNAVMSVDSLKRFISLINKIGYNQVHLYMEDTYELQGEDHFGYLRGKYSAEELKELDDFCYGIGVELVPNIQTLAHMSAFARFRGDIMDVGDIMLVGNDKVYDLIDRMFASLRKCFRTDNIHIGMDEAFMLGRGKYYDIHGTCDRTDILFEHLNRVCEIADRYNYKPMMWSDMFYRIANGGEYYITDSKFDSSIKSLIPKNLSLVYWDYYSQKKNIYDSMIKGHRQLSDNLVFGGGAWKWSGFAPNNYFALKATRLAINACKDGGIKDVFMTMWGDNGAECSSFSVLPTLCYAACLAQGINKMSDVKEKFEEWVGIKYDDFILLDLPNRLENVDRIINPCKYFLYADCFMSIFENTEKTEYSKSYASFARRLRSATKRAGEYSYLFTTLKKLCDVLAIKVNICSRTREAYYSNDKDQLNKIISDYKKMIKHTEEFYKAFREQWYHENKPHGFDVQDIRIGGLIQRMRSCLDRLCDYKNGKITNIPELEEKIVPIVSDLAEYNNWATNSSTNLI